MKKLILIATLSATLVVAFAQPGGPPGGGGPGRRMGPMTMGGGLLMSPDVQKELGMTASQKQKVEALFKSMPRPSMPEPGKRPEPPKGMDDFEKKLKAILNASQLARFEQLQLQARGPMAIMEPETAKKLGLTEKQKTQVRDIFQSSRRPQPPQSKPGERPDFEKMQKDIAKYRNELNAKLLGVLTADQRKKWSSMIGKPFKFPTGPMMGGTRR
ncbi:MAG: hypothetical protein K1X67_05015 [Fimbriimonadaceae bacterium]|nr:hypothetical protein [Fimbriimonadaceae bacterium]